MSFASRTPSLTPSRSSTPEPPVQPHHFYGADSTHLPPSPDSDGKTWLDPGDDPLAHRGIPVFKPTMEEFQDFEGYVSKIECWGSRSGIVKIIPPAEWTAELPHLNPQLSQVKIKTPIEQHMLGSGGLFRQENMEKRKIMSVREWMELCNKDEFRAPGVGDIGLHARSTKPKLPVRKSRRKASTVKAETVGPKPDVVEIKEEPIDDDQLMVDSRLSQQAPVTTPPSSIAAAGSPAANGAELVETVEEKPKVKGRRVTQTREARDASLADRAARDAKYLETFEPHQDWLPPGTKSTDYTPDFCQKLERQYWRNCGLGKSAWYGADTQGSLYTDDTKAWNVAHLPSTLSRILPSSDQGLPGVNTPYLYFGMWRATFAWHVEDMDLFSINYIHFGAPKFWYSVPQGRAGALEQTMRGYFPKDTSQCPQFLRHKSFLASPTLLAQSSCRPNHLVQHSGEFVITFPRGYHAGFNLGINCAESVNFALDSWLELGRRAKACECISDSVRIDVDQLLRDRALEAENPPKESAVSRSTKPDTKSERPTSSRIRISRKRKSDGGEELSNGKKIKIQPVPSKVSSSSHPPPPAKPPLHKISVTLKLGPRPPEPDDFPCCLCISMSREGLLRVHDPPVGRRDANDGASNPKIWMAHEECANVVPETWVDEIDKGSNGMKERVIFGVDGIVKDRWNLKCSACTKSRPKAHGAPIQCTKGKCPKAFHVSCASGGKESGIVFTVLREVEKEVVLLDPATNTSVNSLHDQMQVDQIGQPIDSNDVRVDSASIHHDGTSGSRVLKVIRKVEVQVLCTQHNPAVAAAKKASKQDKIKNDLLALPSMSRIKIRVSAGVFEVSLIRVIEETSSVEVLWDRGVKREFKWGSVVFGSTDGPVQQKPSELGPEPQRVNNMLPVTTYPSVLAATATYNTSSAPLASSSNVTTTQAGPTAKRYATTTQYIYPPRTTPYDYWPYRGQGMQGQYPAAQNSQNSHSYGYTGYYPTATTLAGPSPHFNAYAYNQNHYRGGQLNWQQPYQGPGPSGSTDYYRMMSSQQPQGYPLSQGQPQIQSSSAVGSTVTTPTNTSASSSLSQPVVSAVTLGQSHETPPVDSAATSSATTSAGTLSVEEQAAVRDFAALAELQPSQISAILRDNPQLRDMVWAAVDKTQKVNS